MLVARVLHVGGGVFWVGAVVFTSVFLLPSIRDAGPDGAKVAAGLQRRRYMDWLPAIALITVLSGFYLYWKVSAGFAPAFMGSVPGMMYGTGSVTALIALLLGLGIVRPSMLEAAALSQEAPAEGPGRAEALARAQALRARAGGVGKVISLLLVITAITMAVARYL